MEKIQNKFLEKVNNGYGINQAMACFDMKQDEVEKLMSEDYDFMKKLQKRYKNIDWIQSFEFGVKEEPKPSKQDTPAMALLKKQADELGIKYHPSIGYDTLKKKVDEAKK